MKKLVTIICFLTICLVCEAQEIIIRPQFAVGDTLKYRATAQVIMHHGNDSLFSTTTMLPQIVVEEQNEKGLIIKTNNSLETFKIDCTDPEAKGVLPNNKDELNEFVDSYVLKIQLGKDYQPDSILNMVEVKESLLQTFIKKFTKEAGKDVTNSAEWEKDTKPLLIGTINMMYTPKHLIEEFFCNIPYFNFIGTPLKSGKIPASMVLSDKLQLMCPGIKDLKMKVCQVADNMEHSITKSDEIYSISIQGKKGKTEIEGVFLYAGGILNHGLLSIKTESDTEKLITNFLIDSIK